MATATTEQSSTEDSLPSNATPPLEDAAPAQPVDTGEQQSTTEAATTPTPPVEDAPKVDPRPRDDLGRFAPKDESAPDPVQDAIAKLAKPEASPPKAEAKPSTPAPPAKAAPEAKPAPDALKTRTNDDDLDPTDAEKARWSTHTRERFEKIRTAVKAEREAREAEKPLVESGREFKSLLEDFSLGDDIGYVPKEHLAGLVKAQAALNRGLIAISQGRNPAKTDVEAVMALSATIETVKSKFGVAPTTQAAAVAPFTGELPTDLKDLVDVYGIDEKRVRLLAAMEAKAPTTTTQQAPPPQPAVQQQPPPKPEGVDVDELYTRRFVSEIAATGDKSPAQTLRVLLAHPVTAQEVMRRFPGTTPAAVPAVFNALDPRERYDVLRAAHGSLTKQTAVRPTTPPPATPTRGLPPATTPRQAATSSGDPVSDAIAFMARS